MLISVIIPVYNEATNLGQTLESVLGQKDVEIIVVDGGSTDTSVAIALSYPVQVIQCTQAARAQQMNRGTALARGEVLLFLHGDTLLPSDYSAAIRKVMQVPGIVGGAFSLAISGTNPLLPWVARGVNWRSRYLSLPYGDQAIFVHKSLFTALGGFPDLPIMEDFQFILNLRRQGKMIILPSTVITSGRRWQRLGVWKTTLINQLVILGYFLGVKPEKLAQFYRQIR